MNQYLARVAGEAGYNQGSCKGIRAGGPAGGKVPGVRGLKSSLWQLLEEETNRMGLE